MWLWNRIGETHVFVYDQRKAMEELALTPGVAKVERNVSDLEAQLMEEVAPNLVKALKGKFKYVVIAPVGVLWEKSPKRVIGIGTSIVAALYKKKPKFLKEEKVVDYAPTDYQPVSRLKSEQGG